jgi:tetratricopeptide (TPR) repeat protein
MMRPRSSPTDPLEVTVSRARSRVEAIFRRHGLSAEEAREILFEAVEWLESPYGVVPGAGHRLIRSVEAASRRIRTALASAGSATTDYLRAFSDLLETVRRRREESEKAKEACRISFEGLANAEAVPSLDHDAPQALSKELVADLLERARALWKSDPSRSLEVAQRALTILARIPIDSPYRRYLADLEARGYGYAANALRLLFDYRQADREFEAAQATLAQGTHDPRERAQVLMLLSLLRRDQRRFAEALRHLQQAAAIYRWTREDHLEGTIFMTMATIHSYAGHPELAIPVADRARELLDHERDPRMSAGLQMNIAHYLCAADRAEEARQQIELARPLVEAAGTPNDLRGLRWIEGQIALALGERDEGDSLLSELREEYARIGDSFNAALVSLELVAVYLEQGRTADAKRLAAESLPIFQSLEIHRETLAALIALQRATEVETATAGVVRELLERMRRGNAAPPPRPEKPS